MITVEDILKDTSTFAYHKVPKITDRTQLHLLATHPDRCVRLMAAKLCPEKYLPAFMGSTDPAMITLIEKKLTWPSPTPASDESPADDS
jgi:hypothetical protein